MVFFTSAPGKIERGNEGVEPGRHKTGSRCVFVCDFEYLAPPTVVKRPFNLPDRPVGVYKRSPPISGPALDRLVQRRDRPAQALASLQGSKNKGNLATMHHAGTCVRTDVVKVVALCRCLGAVQIRNAPPKRCKKCIARHFAAELALVGNTKVQRSNKNARLAHFLHQNGRIDAERLHHAGVVTVVADDEWNSMLSPFLKGFEEGHRDGLVANSEAGGKRDLLPTLGQAIRRNAPQ